MLTHWPPMIEQWRPLIEREAARQRVDPALVAAVMWAESGGDPDAARYEEHVDAWSLGLMQVMTFDWRPAPELLSRPEFNVYYGVSVLSESIRLADGNVRLGLAAYNCGFAGVARNACGRWGGYLYADKVLEQCVEFGGCGEARREEGVVLECEVLTANSFSGARFC